MKDWVARRRKRARMDRKRHARLMRKIQKAQALGRADEILGLATWGKRFGRTARLRAA
ncbi:MAG: hypothetical protein M3416_01315 [Acidobacteriota bacterium]|nr:hypothetical protein [Acidobacteriota bacterium]